MIPSGRLFPKNGDLNGQTYELLKRSKLIGVEIEDPYYKRMKLVIGKTLKLYRCDEGKKHTRITNHEQ